MNNTPIIMVVNSGSSSIKLSLFQIENTAINLLLDANLKEMKSEKGRLKITSGQDTKKYTFDKPVSLEAGIKFILDTITQNYSIDLKAVSSIGHRVVHGGSEYLSITLLNQTVIEGIEKISRLAPLHNKTCLEGIKSCLSYFGENIPQYAVFDTAFHRTMPEVASQYAIDVKTASKYCIKRYGFHGISHEYLWNAYLQHIGPTTGQNSKIITLHLGNGCSMTAINGGISIDTSMGFTPAEGLVMGTRAGDVDSAIVEFLCVNDNKTPSQAMDLLNHSSGLLGISQVSSDMASVLEAAHGNKQAQLAIDMFCYRALKYLGSYLTVLGGADAIIFSAGIGENSPEIRAQIMHGMEWCGIKIDEQLNQSAKGLSTGEIKKISTSDSKIPVYVIPTDENRFIAQEIVKLPHH